MSGQWAGSERNSLTIKSLSYIDIYFIFVHKWTFYTISTSQWDFLLLECPWDVLYLVISYFPNLSSQLLYKLMAPNLYTMFFFFFFLQGSLNLYALWVTFLAELIILYIRIHGLILKYIQTLEANMFQKILVNSWWFLISMCFFKSMGVKITTTFMWHFYEIFLHKNFFFQNCVLRKGWNHFCSCLKSGDLVFFLFYIFHSKCNTLRSFLINAWEIHE